MAWYKTSFHTEAASYSSDKNDLCTANLQGMVSYEDAKKVALNLEREKWSMEAERFLWANCSSYVD